MESYSVQPGVPTVPAVKTMRPPVQQQADTVLHVWLVDIRTTWHVTAMDSHREQSTMTCLVGI